MAKSKLLIISTGGTIAQVKDERTGASVISNEEGQGQSAETFKELTQYQTTGHYEHQVAH